MKTIGISSRKTADSKIIVKDILEASGVGISPKYITSLQNAALFEK